MTDLSLPVEVGSVETAPAMPGFDPSHALDTFSRWLDAERVPGGQMFYRGRRMVKHPIDVWNYIEAIQATKPDVIIETGTFEGGSAEFFADLMPWGRVITIDVEDFCPDLGKVAPPIYRLLGLSTDPAILQGVRDHLDAFDGKPASPPRVMVVLDSDHSTPNVLAELEAYSGFVTPGCYLVVEDSNLGGNPVPIFTDYLGEPTDGPMGAIREWKPWTRGFGADISKHRWGHTFNPYGWLVRL